MAQAASKGNCYLCGETISKTAFKKHLMEKHNDAAGDAQTCKLLKVEGVDVVGFTKVQEAIRDNCREEYFTIIMRRFMMRIAQAIAKDHGAKCLVTGENLGQVASQTMDAMAVTGAVVDIPMFHPLIGMDKEEIVTRARKIGTLETSILPYEDCCTVFTPKHPKTKPVLALVEAEEAKLDVDALVADALANTEKVAIRYYED